MAGDLLPPSLDVFLARAGSSTKPSRYICPPERETSCGHGRQVSGGSVCNHASSSGPRPAHSAPRGRAHDFESRRKTLRSSARNWLQPFGICSIPTGWQRAPSRRYWRHGPCPRQSTLLLGLQPPRRTCMRLLSHPNACDGHGNQGHRRWLLPTSLLQTH